MTLGHELIKEKIVLEQKIGRNTTQVLLEGDIIVPDVKPDMSVILQSDAKVGIDRFEVSSDRVSFMGRMEISILYLGRGSAKPVHSMSMVTQIDDFINIDGVTRDMWVEVAAELTNIDYKMLNDRKISYRAVVDVSVSCERTEEHDIVVNIGDIPANQLLKTSLAINRRVENRTDRINVSDSLAIPVGKPNIGVLLQTSVTLGRQDVRVGSGKVTVNGELVVTNLYSEQNEGRLIEIVENEVPFSGVIEIEAAREDMIADVTLAVQHVSAQIAPDNDGEDRIIDIEATLGVVAKVHSVENLEVLEDAYCINKELEISKTAIKYPKLICRNKNQCPFKEIVQLPQEAPPMLSILRVSGKPILDECKVMEDKVVVEGIIMADILYVAENDDVPLFSHKTILPFRQLIDTKGSSPGMNIVMDLSNDHVGFNMLSTTEVELRFLLSFGIQVVDERQCNMITDIAFHDIEPAKLGSMASMVLYVVQKGDTLWNIAKKYNTSIDSLLHLNELDAPPKALEQGQKLLLLR
ncbi:MAG: DUF3794 domain-containing protein [Defluviitaleaceae bacterium]|nr:DUF3794 domain-containing protein [Defluviitaleaceae bacterium]